MKKILLIPAIAVIVFISGCTSSEPAIRPLTERGIAESQQTNESTSQRSEPSSIQIAQMACDKFSWPPDCNDLNDPPIREECEQCKISNPELWINNTYGTSTPQKNPADELPSCGTNNVFFTASPLDSSDLMFIYPLGNFNPTGHTFPTRHLYFHIRKGGYGSAMVPLYAPGNMWITSVVSTENLDKNEADYKLEFYSCREFGGYFGHVTSISKKLKDKLASPDWCNEYTTGGERYKYCSRSVMIEVKAGEQLGTAGGLSSAALDFGAFDKRRQLQYANPSRFDQDELQLHMDCAIDYYEPGLRDSLRTKLGDGSVIRTTQPVCGEIEQDESGTSQGIWFVKGTANTYPEDPHLALVHDNIEPSKGVISAGTSISGLDPAIYYFIPQKTGTTNLDFKYVKPGGIYCYELTKRFGGTASVIIQMTGATTLKIEKISSCSQLSFTSPTEFER